MTTAFPDSLDMAINNLINTLVYKLITRESDGDALQEFVDLTGISSVTDVNVENYARQKAEEIWGPYKQLPLPSAFDAPIAALAGAHNRLTNTGVTNLDDAERFSLGALVPEFMADFRIDQAGWRGATIDAVRSNYLDRWGGMVFLQANTLALLWLVLKAYQTQVQKAQEDVVDLVTKAEQVIASYDPSSLCGSSDKKNLTFNIAIGVLSVLSGAAGLAEGAAMAITSVASAVAAAGLGVAKDAYEPNAPKGGDIQGDTVAEIWHSILDRTEDLRKQFAASDKELHDIVDSFHSKIVDGKIVVGKSGQGETQTVPAMELFRSKPLDVGTSNLQRPYIGSDNPDPAHSPQR